MYFSIKRAIWSAHSLWSGGSIVAGPSVPKVALTFDDGPSERWTSDICSILEDKGAKSSFFMVGKHVEQLPNLAKNVALAGHEPCVHLYSHSRSVADNNDEFAVEIAKSKQIIEEATGTSPSLLRFPFAYMGRQYPKTVLDRFGLHTVHWSFSSLDSRGNSEQIAKRVSKWIFPGAIVLFHDGVGAESSFLKSRDATVKALPAVLESVRSMGFEAVTITELLNSH